MLSRLAENQDGPLGASIGYRPLTRCAFSALVPIFG